MSTSGLAGPHLSLNPLTDFDQLTAFPFMVNALEAGAIVAVLAAVAGWFMVLRRESFVGHTLSVMSFPGASGATLIGLPAAAGYFAFAGAGALVIAAASHTAGRRDPAQESAVVGSVQVLGLAAGFLFLSLDHGIFESLETLLFGSILGITRAQVLTLVAVAAASLLFFPLAGRRLLFASVDEEVARANGLATRLLHTAFLLVLGLAVAATAQITGVLLVFALLVAPAAAAQELTARVGLGLALSVAIAVLVTWVGSGLAYFTDYPVGFYVTTLAFAVFVAARAAGGRTAGRPG
ncbi:MAG: zinc/manganese transport system permease protein [Solirubrobacteraceae bacterium]|nr:zinc/manganese transport system permease protein [Solirubrobacteraceae bacterium]